MMPRTGPGRFVSFLVPGTPLGVGDQSTPGLVASQSRANAHPRKPPAAVLVPVQESWLMEPEGKPALEGSLAERQRPLFEKLDLFKAWEMTRGNPDVLVGLI